MTVSAPFKYKTICYVSLFLTMIPIRLLSDVNGKTLKISNKYTFPLQSAISIDSSVLYFNLYPSYSPNLTKVNSSGLLPCKASVPSS